GDSVSAHPIQALAESGSIAGLLGTDDGTLWVGASNGLVRLAGGEERRFTTADGLAGDDVLCLAAGADGALWIGTRAGFSRLRGEEFESFRPRDGLSQSSVYAICEDRE